MSLVWKENVDFQVPRSTWGRDQNMECMQKKCKHNFISESVWESKGRNPKALKVISHFASWDCQGMSNV